jgi:hypothetical protein
MMLYRIEASSIPTLLVAPNGVNGSTENEGEEVERSMYNNGIGDSRGYYEDGAYTAAPAVPLESPSPSIDNDDMAHDAQAAYYATLLKRFGSLRERLKSTPPRHAVERLDSNHPSHISSSTTDYKNWRWRLRNTDPVPAQLAAMDKGTVLKLLGVLGRQRFLREEKDALKMREQRCVASWIWGLLAKLPERGELASEEVGVVRELGKRAVWVGVEIKGVDMGELHDGGGSSGEEDCREDREHEEEVLDVEVNVNDEEFGDSDEGFGGNSMFENGDGTTEQRSSDSEPSGLTNATDAEAPQVIGPVLPTPAAGHIAPSSSSPSHAKPTLDPTSSDIEIDHKAHLFSQHDQAEAELTAARERILARLAGQDDEIDEEGSKNLNKEVFEEVGEGKEIAGRDVGRTGDEQEESGENEENHKVSFRATLDMIITIAGEVYGQRDLLEFREIWVRCTL